MICELVRMEGGGVAYVCRDGRRRRCAACGGLGATLLCDGPPAAGSRRKNCDRPLCARCATHVEGKDLDFCPEHRPARAGAAPEGSAPSPSGPPSPEPAMRGGSPQQVGEVLAEARRNAGVTDVPTRTDATAPPRTEVEKEEQATEARPNSPEDVGFLPTDRLVATSSPAPGTARCNSCGAEIYWAKSDSTGTNMPVDAEPLPSGNVALYKRGDQVIARVLGPAERHAAQLGGQKLRLNHFVTCPNRAKHRRKP